MLGYLRGSRAEWESLFRFPMTCRGDPSEHRLYRR